VNRNRRKSKKMSPLLRYMILAALGIVIGVNVYYLNASKLAGNQVPMPFGIGASVVLSGSMEPALSVGDLLFLHEKDHYAVGDIVVYQSGSIPIVHRIIYIDSESVVTQGDANNVSDAPISVESVRGKVVASVPLVGYAVWAFKTPIGIVATIVAAFFLIELSYRDKNGKEDDENELIKAEIRKLMEELQTDSEDKKKEEGDRNE